MVCSACGTLHPVHKRHDAEASNLEQHIAPRVEGWERDEHHSIQSMRDNPRQWRRGENEQGYRSLS